MRTAISERTISVFRQALEAFNKINIPYVIGGAFAVHHYSEVWRNTDDLDLYIERHYLPLAIDILSKMGFRDRGEMAAGDRTWIYHAIKNRVLVDLIWQPPNGMPPVNESFFTRGPEGEFLGIPTRFLPADELILAKIFTMNRHRCDWPDIFQIVRMCPKELDWHYLLDQMGEHWPVLLSFMVLYDWAYPSEARCIPQDIREELVRRKQEIHGVPSGPARESMLDPWIYTRPLSP